MWTGMYLLSFPLVWLITVMLNSFSGEIVSVIISRNIVIIPINRNILPNNLGSSPLSLNSALPSSPTAELPHLYKTLNVQQVMYNTLDVQQMNIQHLEYTTHEYTTTWMYNTLNIQHLECTTLECTTQTLFCFYFIKRGGGDIIACTTHVYQ